MPPTSAPTPIAATTFLAQNRGGGLFSELVSQRAGAYLALAAYRLRVSPSALTIAGLVVGVGASVALLLLAPTTTHGTVPALVVGLMAGLGWQLAYALDCADGQLARVTGRTSAAGARLDILCDVAVQISLVAAVSGVTAAHSPSTSAWLYAIFAGTWMVNLVTSVLSGGPAAGSLITSRSVLVRFVKLIRDYGAIIAATAVILALVPGWTLWLMAVMSTVNGLFLIASIVRAVRASHTHVGPS